MERKDFIKNSFGFLGMAFIAPSFLKPLTANAENNSSVSCVVSNNETAGPFPTITPASLVTSNIVGDRTGVAFTINITINNVNDSCNPLQGAIVDIWHCDKDGNYSEYGGTSMQPTNYTAYHFLRGRQTTNASGMVSYTSIFPGWYTSRATHIHVHVYSASGVSLLITQIAFPEGTGSAVSTVNAATAYGYTKGMSGYTYNASDNVFSDGTGNEMSVISGSLSAGYVLDFEGYVSAPVTTGVLELSAESQFRSGQNYPNPFIAETSIPVVLKEPSTVLIFVYGMDGKKILQLTPGDLTAGEHNISLSLPDIASGRYIYTLQIENTNGTFQQSKLMVKK